MGVAYNPGVVADSSLLLSLDFSNPKNYVSGTAAVTSVTPYDMTFYNGATYNSASNGVITFTRAASTATKTTAGGGIYATGSGNLASTTFLYNDFTWEIWFRIDDITASNYDANETQSAIAVYRGYHAGFYYNSSTMSFPMWTGLSTSATVATWTVGTSGAQINQGVWYQIALTRVGNVFTPYVNGAQLGTGSTTLTPVAGVATGNSINIGSSCSGSDFLWYSKSTFSNMKMYNRALSAVEIKQNFNALRGRFGI